MNLQKEQLRCGIIYQDDYTGGQIVREKITTVGEDRVWLEHMRKKARSNIMDRYELGAYDCTVYSEKEFNTAPGREKPIAPSKPKQPKPDE
jgi:hypothetical protein